MTNAHAEVFAWEVNDAAFCELKIALTATVGDLRTGPRERGKQVHQDIEDAVAMLPIPEVGSFDEAVHRHADGRKIILPEMMLVSEDLGLQGRPDLVIWGESLDSFEFKSGAAPKRSSRRLGTRAFESDAAQALVYGLLLEERFGVTPSLWIIYGEGPSLDELRAAPVAWGLDISELEKQLARARPIHVPFTDGNRQFVETLVARARAIKADPRVAERNHEISARCSRCAFRDVCERRLA